MATIRSPDAVDRGVQARATGRVTVRSADSADSADGAQSGARRAADRGTELRGEALRADWLKLRGYLFDPLTRLPALPAVLDEVRRHLEGSGNLALLYLDLSGGGHAEAASGWQSHDDMLRHVADSLSESCRGLRRRRGGRAQVAQVGVRSDEFVLFLESDGGAGADDELSAVRDRVTDAVAEALRRRQPDGEAPPPVDSALIHLQVEPTLRIERAIYRSVDRARERCRLDRARRQSGRLAELRRMLDHRDVVIRFQPIVDLSSGAVHGVEALSAAPHAGTFENPEMLFAFAEQSDVIVDLERLCRNLAVQRSAALLPADGKLFLNCSAHAFADPQLLSDLAGGAESLGAAPGSVVLEVTERVAITEWRAFRRTLDQAREAGLLVAIDDMGSGYSSLHSVAEIEPDYLKFDLSLIHGIHRSPIKRDLFETLVSLADKIGARGIAEGIEEREEFDTVRDLGVTLGQGYFFARPATPDAWGEVHFPG